MVAPRRSAGPGIGPRRAGSSNPVRSGRLVPTGGLGGPLWGVMAMAEVSGVVLPRVVTSGSGTVPGFVGQTSVYSSVWDCGVFDLATFGGDGAVPPAAPAGPPARRWYPGLGLAPASGTQCIPEEQFYPVDEQNKD